MFYCSVIRSVLEYDDILWHGGLTSIQSQDIEIIQKRALSIIATDLYYEDALATIKQHYLKERRELHCIELIKQMSSPLHKLHYLLPEKVRNVRQRGTRYDGDKFYNFKYRTDRFKKRPLVYAIDKYNSSF